MPGRERPGIVRTVCREMGYMREDRLKDRLQDQTQGHQEKDAPVFDADLKKKRHFEHWQIIAFLLMLFDMGAAGFSYVFALWIRFDLRFTQIDSPYFTAWRQFTIPYMLFCVLVFYMLRMYRSIWRFASYNELIRVMIGSAITAVCHTIGITVFCRRMPVSYYILGAMTQFMLVLGIRISYRLLLMIRNRYYSRSEAVRIPRVMLIGAGSAGQMLLRDIYKAEELHERVVCIIDDNSNKWNRYIDGIPVVGGRDAIAANVSKYHVDKIYIALPSASAAQKKEILEICKDTGCELKNLPGMYQLAKGDVTVSDMKDVSVEDLLGREPIETNLKQVFEFLQGKVVLVTGGGGSIGSELCRQIAAHKPKQLIILDIYENSVYDIQLELKKNYPNLNLVVLIGSVRDSRRIFGIFEQYRPQVVYHAAAHKHVPLMEDSPNEAIKNNAIGTYKTAYAAMVHGCDRFVLISTDKAVNPTNIMGASKRLCEMIIQSFDARIKEGRAKDIPQLFTHEGIENADKDGTGEVFRNAHTEFVAVRFGNVLGSNGSVIPLFRRQIAAGGPVTVTHPDIIRYFMTIPEAVSLVLTAGTYASGGEIFVLDMGSPVRIDTMARNLIKLSGYKPDVDIKIVYTGLRPGEKLYEEKLMAEEGLRKTANELIFIGLPIPFDTDVFLRQLEELMYISYQNHDTIREQVAAMVSTYHPVD